jgi:hypothetical protein
MYALAVVLFLSIVGFLLFMLFFKKDISSHNIVRKRSGRDRRKGFYASKNRMRRSDKDRRQSKGENNEAR